MIQKPKHLSPEYAAVFRDRSVAEAYGYRSPYPDEVYALLRRLIAGRPRRLLELGCGPGEISRTMASELDLVDAVDPSAAMLEVARSLPGGGHPHLSWHETTAEEFAYPESYALILTPESLAWLDWEVVFPSIAGALAPRGRLVVLVRDYRAAWDADTLGGIVPRYSTNRDFVSYDVVAELERHGLFEIEERVTTAPVTVVQPVEDYIEFWHSRSGFSRERMGARAAGRFDDEVRALVSPHALDGTLRFEVTVDVTWGVPRAT